MRLNAVFTTLALAATPLVAQDAPESGGFIVRLGTDTIVVERFARTASRLEGEYLARAPRTVLRRWGAALAPDGAITRFEMTSQRLGEPGSAPEPVALEFSGDRAGIIPFVGNSWALLEQAVRRWRATGAAHATQRMLPPGEDDLMSISLERRGGDSVTVTIFDGNPNAVRTDEVGRVLGVNGFGQLTVERLPALDMAPLAASFAFRPLGMLSPRDTARAEVAGAHIAVDYSRPSRRGRTVFGGIVPWDRVWRTGANTATTLITDADLVIGGTNVPAGRYSLYTIPGPAGWTLIINRDADQSGTEYNAARDLARVTMRVETLPQLVEQFTIAIEPRGNRGVLQLEWETTRAWVEITGK